MSSLKEIRKRILSVKNTQKITKAMKMVAAAKLRRAQLAVVAARPYANKLTEVVELLASQEGENKNPLLIQKENPKKSLFLLFTSNRGLCGGFNSNLLRKVEAYLSTLSHEVIDIEVIGKKGRDFYNSRKKSLKEVHLDLANEFPFSEAVRISTEMINQFLTEKYDQIFIVYNRFVSALTQNVEIQQVLPMVSLKNEKVPSNNIDFIYEPSKDEVLDYLLPKFIATQLYRAHLESLASELGSRMTAMDSATKNAKEMIGNLTLVYNRARQAAITVELMDIVNGSESIK